MEQGVTPRGETLRNQVYPRGGPSEDLHTGVIADKRGRGKRRSPDCNTLMTVHTHTCMIYYHASRPGLAVFKVFGHPWVLIQSHGLAGARLRTSCPRGSPRARVCCCRLHLCEAVASAATALVVLGCSSGRRVCLSLA